MSCYKVCVSNAKKKSRDKVIKRIADEAGISKEKLTVETSSRKRGYYEIIVEGEDIYQKIVKPQLRLGSWTITPQVSYPCSPTRLNQTQKSSDLLYTLVNNLLIVTLSSNSPDIKAQTVVEKLIPSVSIMCNGKKVNICKIYRIVIILQS